MGGFYPDKLKIEQLAPVFLWIKAQMDRYAEMPIIMAFQAIDDGYYQVVAQFSRGLLAPKPFTNLIFIIFSLTINTDAHFHNKLCLSWGLQVPILLLGTQPNDNYPMIQLNPFSRGFKNVYNVTAFNSTYSLASDMDLSSYECF